MTSALEDIKSIELSEWLTLATAPSPTKLKPGQTPYAFNTWVDEKPGSVITANGFRKVGALPSGNPGTFCINYFKTSAGTQIFVVSDNATVWTTIDFQSFTSIITGLSSSFQLRGAVIRDKLWLTNGNDSVRTFDGTSVTVLDGTGGTPTVPKGRYIAYHDERVWIGHISSGRSQCYFSALTDASGTIIAPDNASAWPNTNFLQVSEGDADFLTGLFLYRGYLHFFKQYSIWRLVGYDEYTYTRVKTRASTGTRFNESIQELDSLIHMIGVDGLYVFDGEETARISDIIDPATAEQTAFGFNQLQQPNTNNLFWEVSSTSDWNAGTPSRNIAVNNDAAEAPADDSQADFQAGTTLTNIDATTNPGFIQLSRVASGGSSLNVALNQSALVNGEALASQVGQGSFITDGNLSNQVGAYTGLADNINLYFEIDFSTAQIIGSATIKSFFANRTPNAGGYVNYARLEGLIAGVWTQLADFGISGNVNPAIDSSVSFAGTTVSAVRLRVNVNSGGQQFGGSSLTTIAELQVFSAAFQASGQFVSRALNLGLTPSSLGNFYASTTLNGEAISYQTQSSADGISWDAAVAVTNGGAIGSTPRQYLRWIANFTSDGLNTPVLDFVYLPAVYLSVVHDTGGNIFAWGAFEADYQLNSQTISFYYRGATTSGGVSAASWNLIVPGGAINMSVNNRYVQFKLEYSGFTANNNPPLVNSVTLNWVVGSGTQPQVLQNVASFFWRNRYWLSAAGAGASANNTVLIRGKKTFGSPWQLKDWNMLAFTRYLDNLYGTDSTNANIYQLDTGYSKDGASLNSIFETGDFTFKGFQAQIIEILIETERLGPYTLFVGHSTDQGNNWVDHSIDLTPVTGGTSSFWKRINNLNLTTDKLRLRFYINAVDQPFQVHNAIIYYKLSAQRATVGVN